MVPVDDQKEDSEVEEYVILKLEENEDGEEFFVTIDDDEEYDDITDVFDDLFSQEVFYEDEN